MGSSALFIQVLGSTDVSAEPTVGLKPSCIEHSCSQQLELGPVLHQQMSLSFEHFPLKVPPLKERKADIPILVKFFLTKFIKGLGKKIDIA